MDLQKINKISKNVVIFLAVFLVVNYLFNSCQGEKNEENFYAGTVSFATTEAEFSRTSTVKLEIKNNTSHAITIPNECPSEPFTVYKYEKTEWTEISVSPELNCSSKKDIILNPGDETIIAYDNWNNAIFGDMGRFKIEFETEVEGKKETLTTPEFLVVKEGLFSQLWNGIFYRPIYNGLIFLTKILPGHSLGFAIILLTIIIRTILIAPAHKAMKEQRKMQELQPRLAKIKEDFKGDQQKIAAETMALWKEAKVSPFGSCLPILLQFPFLIAVFWVIRSGLNPDQAHLLYTAYENFNIKDIDVNFLGILDLTKMNLYVLPLIVGGLQFAQMKLALAKKGKKVATHNKEEKKEKNEMEMASSMMVYFMPVMIAVFTASVPAGVGLYWGTSTIYGIVQQIFVNKDKASVSKNDPSVKVKVIS
ncbi:MAG: YidC/Oxa1 family membrane protein insertase [Candidatus Gracilibacteria bacterium]|nr:YidC/Oxa1 family membrane protein insertase [Candidatus Gracilibacteria bacterium]